MNSTQERLSQLELKLKERERWLIGIESTVYFAVIFTALLGNIVLCLAVYKKNTIRSRQNYYLVSLAATDILNAVVCMPLTLAVLIQGTWPFGDFICQLQGSFIAISTTVSLLTLGTIAVNRYFKIVKSASLYHKVFSKRNILISIAITWIVTAIFVFGTFAVRKTMFHFHPGKCLCWLRINLRDKEYQYSMCIYAITQSLTFSAIIFSYCKVFRKIRAHFVQVANSFIQNDTSTAFAEEVKISAMLFVTILAFFICWTPSIIIDFYEVLAGYYTLPRQVYLLNIFTYASSSVVNPIIYGLMKREFKEAYKQVLCCKEA